MRVITVTPAGRKSYLQVLVPYLLQNRQHIREHHFWLNTTNKADIGYINDLTRKYPDLFKIVRRPVLNPQRASVSIWQYFQDYVDEDTLYIRFDDDICYIAPDAIPALIAFRRAHPEPFLVYGNIVNNAICSYYQQVRGLIPQAWGTLSNTCFDPVGWESGVFARQLHSLFLEDIRSNSTARWKFPAEVLGDYRRFSINVISWFGRDMLGVPELTIQKLLDNPVRLPDRRKKFDDEEALLSEYLPAVRGRPNVICGDALFGHFAFYPQRHYLEHETQLLEEYAALVAPWQAHKRRLRQHGRRFLKPVRSSAAWRKLRRKSNPSSTESGVS